MPGNKKPCRPGSAAGRKEREVCQKRKDVFTSHIIPQRKERSSVYPQIRQ
nr:MAG TPA: hypothetical protein [Caudoviricetes sp.]